MKSTSCIDICTIAIKNINLYQPTSMFQQMKLQIFCIVTGNKFQQGFTPLAVYNLMILQQRAEHQTNESKKQSVSNTVTKNILILSLHFNAHHLT